jgi:hypothetical protein
MKFDSETYPDKIEITPIHKAVSFFLVSLMKNQVKLNT